MNELSGSPQQAATLLYFYMYLVFSLPLLLILLWFVIYLIFIFQGLKMYYTTFSYILLLLWCAFLTISWRGEDWEESLVYFHVHPLYLAYRIWAHGSAARYFPPRQLQTSSSWFSHFPKKNLGKISVILFSHSFSFFLLWMQCVWIPVKVTSLSGVKANWWKEWRGGKPGFLLFFSIQKPKCCIYKPRWQRTTQLWHYKTIQQFSPCR